MSINTINTNGYLSASLNTTGPAAGPLRPQAGGELPTTQVAPSHAANKAENENAPEVGKAKQQAANERLAGDKRIEGKEDNARQNSEQDAPEEKFGKNGEINEKSTSGREISEEELKQIQQMANRDREVRAHEAAHRAVAGQYAKGGMRFTYEVGPDGKRYAVGGEVSIDTSPVPGDPQATLQKANAIRAAAMAPAEPSGQDRSVAIEAMHMAAKARSEVLAEKIQGGADSETAKATGEDTVERNEVAAAGEDIEQKEPKVGTSKQESSDKPPQLLEASAKTYEQIANTLHKPSEGEPAVDYVV